MKVFVVIISLYCLPLQAICQSSLVDVYKNHRFPCDDETSNLANNICSGIRYEFADSLMNKLYRKIMKSLDDEIAICNLAIKREKGAKDSTNLKFALEDKNRYSRIKQAIVNSQREWIKLRDLNCAVEAIFCEGGTGCTAITNEAYIEETLARIKRLESFNIFD